MSFSQTWNLAKTMAAFPCAEPSPLIVAITLVPAIAPALLEWVSFGCRDLLKFRLGKGVPCGRAMKAQVAKAIPPSFADPINKLLKWEHHFSFAGQMFLLADLASDTLARWTTLAYQLSGCPDALEGAYWSVEFQAPEALPPGIPEPIGGTITNEKGTPGIAWPTGAICPPGWWFSASFDVEARALHSGIPIGLSTWMRESSPHPYDFPGLKKPPGYPGQSTKLSALFTHQARDTGPPTQYTFTAMADQLALTTGFKATCQCTPFPPYDEFLSPLGCLRNFNVEHLQDPAGRNPKSYNPTIIPKWLGLEQPTPPRGPPGGKPRSRK